MKILVKCKEPFKIIEEEDYKKMKELFNCMIEKYDIKVEFKNFKIDYSKK